LLTFLVAVGALRHPVPATHTCDDLLQMPPRPGVVVTGLDRAGSAGMLQGAIAITILGPRDRSLGLVFCHLHQTVIRP
jgi:hypothetical protein